MEPAKYRILFVLHQHDRELDPQLQCRVKWNGSKGILSLNTGYRVDREKWDSDLQRCRPGTFHGARRIPAATINAEIRRYTDAVEESFMGLARAGAAPTAAALRADIKARLGERPVPGEDVFIAFDRFVAEQAAKNSWSDATVTKMRVVRRHLAAWRPKLAWTDFDEAGLSSYLDHLRTVRKQQNATLKKQLGYLRWFLAWADAKGFLPCKDYRHFRPKLKGGGRTVVYLTWDELMRVWDADLSGQRAQARDIFCFCCFTSLRYSDAVNLRWSDVGEKTITVVTVKTADPLTIDLNKWSEEILGRYVDEGYPDDRVFPTIGNQLMNRHLHEICRECGIDTPVHLTWYRGSERHDEVHPKYDLITSHAGRRTFVVTALAMGIPPAVVMKWTGHSDYKAMKPYIDVSDETKAGAMALFDTKKDTGEVPK